MPLNPFIRTATIDDISAMHRLRMGVFENRLSDPRSISESTYRPYVAAETIWLAETGTDVAGFVAIDAQTGRVWALFVDPQAEGGGIGRALHDHMVEWARQQGLRTLSLSTARGTRAEQFYIAAGWRNIGLTAYGELIFEKVMND